MIKTKASSGSCFRARERGEMAEHRGPQQKENSVLFSLSELRRIEEDRIKQEEEAERARVAAEQRARADAERRGRGGGEARRRGGGEGGGREGAAGRGGGEREHTPG